MPVRTRVKLEVPSLIFVTTTVKDHIAIFKNNKLAKIVLDQFVETCSYFDVSIVGYVLMPSHLHAMVGLINASKLSEFMQAFKSLSSRKIKDALNASQRKMFLNKNGGFNL
jgi:REP element-mobilizing transposase RayT